MAHPPNQLKLNLNYLATTQNVNFSNNCSIVDIMTIYSHMPLTVSFASVLDGYANTILKVSVNFSFTSMCSGRPQRSPESASCHPCGVILIQTQRNCQRQLDAWLNTDFLHNSWTESKRGVHRCRRTTLSVWLYCPSSSLRHLDVSHPHHNAQSLTESVYRTMHERHHYCESVCLVNTDKEEVG